jgi:hypothetical protein
MNNWNAKMHDDARITKTLEEVRNLCAGDSRGWKATKAAVRLRTTHCCLCSKPIDMSLRWPNPGSFSVEHAKYRVEDCIGLTRGEARRRLHDQRYLAGAHLSCNSSANRNNGRLKPYAEPAANPWPEWAS